MALGASLMRWVAGAILFIVLVLVGSYFIMDAAWDADVRNAEEHCHSLGAELHVPDPLHLPAAGRKGGGVMDILLVCIAVLFGIPLLGVVGSRFIIGHWPWSRCTCRDPRA